MAVLAGNLMPVGNPLQWSLLFARQPEPDLEFTEEELEQTMAGRQSSPMKPTKKPGGGRSLLWVLLLLLVVGIVYIAMKPEQLADWLGPIMGETVPSEPPPMAVRPKPIPPPPNAPAPQPSLEPGAPPPPSMGTGSPPTIPPPAGTSMPSPPTSPTGSISSPMFSEGQKVAVIGNLTMPSESVPLWLDPAGTKPGPVVRPSSSLTILDGDLQPSGWVYQVKTEDGSKGWVSEEQLRLKF